MVRLRITSTLFPSLPCAKSLDIVVSVARRCSVVTAAVPLPTSTSPAAINGWLRCFVVRNYLPRRPSSKALAEDLPYAVPTPLNPAVSSSRAIAPLSNLTVGLACLRGRLAGRRTHWPVALGRSAVCT